MSQKILKSIGSLIALSIIFVFVGIPASIIVRNYAIYMGQSFDSQKWKALENVPSNTDDLCPRGPMVTSLRAFHLSHEMSYKDVTTLLGEKEKIPPKNEPFEITYFLGDLCTGGADPSYLHVHFNAQQKFDHSEIVVH